MPVWTPLSSKTQCRWWSFGSWDARVTWLGGYTFITDDV